MDSCSSNLLPIRHPNRDFFQCDIFNPTFKGDMASMEHPVFSLSKKPDITIRFYEHNGNTLQIIPSMLGMATIWDKDVLIYCTSQLAEGLNRNRADLNRTIHVTVFDYLVSTNRGTGGKDYLNFQSSLKKLAGTTLNTNIKTNGVSIKEGFGLIDKWKIVEKSLDGRQVMAVEITLSEWLYNSILATQIKSMSSDYFRLKKALERRLYELAKKHCGNQATWKISIEKLLKKSGSKTNLKDFKFKIKGIIDINALPDYTMAFNKKTNLIYFYNRSERGYQKRKNDIIYEKIGI